MLKSSTSPEKKTQLKVDPGKITSLIKIYSKKMMESNKENEINILMILERSKKKENLLEKKKSIRNMKSLIQKKHKNNNRWEKKLNNRKKNKGNNNFKNRG